MRSNFLKLSSISTVIIGISVIIVGIALPVGNAFAARTFTADREEIEALCQDAKGRFDVSWAYDDKGVQHGRQWTCEAAKIRIECQDGICRSTETARDVM